MEKSELSYNGFFRCDPFLQVIETSEDTFPSVKYLQTETNTRQGAGQYCKEDDGVINRGGWISGKKPAFIQCVTRQKSISCP